MFCASSFALKASYDQQNPREMMVPFLGREGPCAWGFLRFHPQFQFLASIWSVEGGFSLWQEFRYEENHFWKRESSESSNLAIDFLFDGVADFEVSKSLTRANER